MKNGESPVRLAPLRVVRNERYPALSAHTGSIFSEKSRPGIPNGHEKCSHNSPTSLSMIRLDSSNSMTTESSFISEILW